MRKGVKIFTVWYQLDESVLSNHLQSDVAPNNSQVLSPIVAAKCVIEVSMVITRSTIKVCK